MRLPLSFAAACLVALALFSLMLGLIAPPSRKVAEDPLTVGHFVRIGATEQSRASASRQPAPDMPQPKTPPQPPTPVTPTAAAPAPKLPSLDLEMPTLSSKISVASAPAPSLEGLAAAAAPAAASAAPAGASGAASGAEAGADSAGPLGGPESEVRPLNDVRPRYPRMALQRNIEGHVKLAFTITRAGAVENIRVLEASPRNVFEREARSAAARWRFAPRTENGLAVDREAVKTLYFKIQRGD
ncbi:energy transducer TonB [Azotobacter chroococcum]|uniref:Protein TonB n=1 Tax=Azotobacter chroococcum TaxID=353 RepID=A0A4R1PRB6_9GAMM|nr:energy transducer TonB [Azotobacter chroococcum]TBV96301.1 energy transducer TonB [Azotobacter chroococcum]TCL34151.1 outer membrane transport energization protein TonB [Azotobacter chroococcum]